MVSQVHPNRIRALGEVQNYMPEQLSAISAEFSGLTLQEVADRLKIPTHAIWFFSVEGKRVPPEYRLSIGESVTIHGPVDGG